MKRYSLSLPTTLALAYFVVVSQNALPSETSQAKAEPPPNETATQKSAATKEAPAPGVATRAELEQKFKETLSNSVLVGRWCLVTDGKLDEESEEKYTIRSVSKLGEDVWIISARVQYGNKDVTVPVPVQVKWAGDTPVISITNLGLPGLGSYTARVVIYDQMYSGTWSGSNHGGLLHGLIKKAE
ncbi:MAG: hypothetical protein EXS30_10765 [Pedosphaera sp.]|nr:hypothetical protein [Pedosphaera sp.]